MKPTNLRYKTKTSRGIVKYAHRVIMEQKLGRKLENNEVVHHKNGDKTDNRMCNLELMTRSEHIRLHEIGLVKTKSHRKKISEGLKKSHQSKKSGFNNADWKEKISRSCKGRVPWNKGKKLGAGFYKKNNI